MTDWKWTLHPTREGLVRAIEQLNCGLSVEDGAGNIVYVNQRVLEWSGYQVEELEGQPAEILIPPELHPALKAERARAQDGDQRTRLSAFQRRDGRTFPVAVAPRVIETAGGEPAVLALLIDLGEVHTARPMGTEDGDLASELANVAQKLQSLTFSATMADTTLIPLNHPLLKGLSDRERDVLMHLMSGSRVPAIAKELFIAPNTVRNHLKAIYRKVGVSSQSELIELVRSLGKPPLA